MGSVHVASRYFLPPPPSFFSLLSAHGAETSIFPTNKLRRPPQPPLSCPSATLSPSPHLFSAFSRTISLSLFNAPHKLPPHARGGHHFCSQALWQDSLLTRLSLSPFTGSHPSLVPRLSPTFSLSLSLSSKLNPRPTSNTGKGSSICCMRQQRTRGYRNARG